MLALGEVDECLFTADLHGSERIKADEGWPLQRAAT
jgi:hypothetical protein